MTWRLRRRKVHQRQLLYADIMSAKHGTKMEKFGTFLSQDCLMIFEAIRRLIEGTCCLQGEEKECTWDLFHKVNEAFSQHKDVEERFLFPTLPSDERLAHRVEHQMLTELLAKARWEFESSEGDRFRAYLQDFAEALKTHHSHDDVSECLRHSGRMDEELESDADMARIVGRAEEPYLH